MIGWFVSAAVAVSARQDDLQHALRLRDAGEFPAAIRILTSLSTARPDDGEVGRVLAQTLYWVKDLAGARRVYESTLARHPEDDRLRIEYARMLAETSDRKAARGVLAPIADTSSRRADALTLLGTIAYWEGDWRSAQRLFTAALERDPAQSDAGRQANELRLATTPWIRVSPMLWHDDQTLDRRSVAVEAGAFLTPLTTLRARAQPGRFSTPETTLETVAAEIELRHAAPRKRVDIELAAGTIHRNRQDAPSDRWTGRGVLTIALASSVKLRGRVERAPYFHTAASLTTRVRTETGAVEFLIDHPRGWLAQTAFEQQRYHDGNLRRSVYGWFLAPVVRGPRGQLQAGYGYSTDDARDSRFVGRYDPYYTPADVVRHSAIGAATAALSRRMSLRLGGMYGFRASEDAPTLVPSGNQLQRVFVARTFSPWDARGSLEMNAGAVTVGVHVEAGRQAFYRWSTATLQVTYRLAHGRASSVRR